MVNFPAGRARLIGRRAIITGAARGIGRACAQRFVEEGAIVLLVDRDASAGEASAKALAGDRDSAHFCHADLAIPGICQSILDVATRTLGGVDVLINSAGVAPFHDFFDLSCEEFDRVMAINVRGPFLLTQAAARVMREQRTGGAIINLSSVAAVLNMPNALSYCVSKGAMNQLTRNCAVTLAPHGIRVNAIGPGTIATDMAIGAGLTEDALKRIQARTPLGRLGDPAEIAAIAAFLASDDASFITGQIVYADGGRLALNYTMPPMAGD